MPDKQAHPSSIFAVTRKIRGGYFMVPALAIGIIFMTSACSPVPGGSNGPKKISVVKKEGKLRLKFSTTKARYKSGQEVPLKLEIVNQGAKATNLKFSSAKTHDFFVVDQGGEQVWSWSAGMVFAQILVEKKLKSGEKWLISSTWDQRSDSGNSVPSGMYQLRASLEAAVQKVDIGDLTIEIF